MGSEDEVMPATMLDQLVCDAEVVAMAVHLEAREHRHGPIIGWVVCVAGDVDHLGIHEIVARVTGKEHRQTVQRLALEVVRSGCEVAVHQVRRCGCLIG